MTVDKANSSSRYTASAQDIVAPRTCRPTNSAIEEPPPAVDKAQSTPRT